jgi:hypothetical protein
MDVLAYFLVKKGVFESDSPAKHFITRVTDLESVSDLDFEFLIIKYNLHGLQDGNFFYADYYQYDFKTKAGKAYQINLSNVECVEISIRQKMSGYASDAGSARIKFKSDNLINEVLIPGGSCQTPLFIGAIIDFMKDFEQNFSANWAYYNKVKELEKANESLANKVSDLEKQLQKLKPITK